MIICLCNQLTPEELLELTDEEYENLKQCGACESWRTLKD